MGIFGLSKLKSIWYRFEHYNMCFGLIINNTPRFILFMLHPRITISHSEEEIEVPYVIDNMTAHERALFVKHMSKWYVKYFGRAVFMNMPYDNKLHKGRMFESKGWYFIVNKRTLLSCQVFVAHPNGSLLTCLSIYAGHNFAFRRMEKGWQFR